MPEITNKYYIIPLAIPGNIVPHIVGGGQNMRVSNNGQLGIVKRRHDDNVSRPEFNAFTPMTHSEILIELAKPMWKRNDEL